SPARITGSDFLHVKYASRTIRLVVAPDLVKPLESPEILIGQQPRDIKEPGHVVEELDEQADSIIDGLQESPLPASGPARIILHMHGPRWHHRLPELQAGIKFRMESMQHGAQVIGSDIHNALPISVFDQLLE